MKKILLVFTVSLCCCFYNGRAQLAVVNPSQETQDLISHFESMLEAVEQTLNLTGLYDMAKKIRQFSEDARKVTSKIKYTAKVIRGLQDFVGYVEQISEMISDDIKYYKNMKALGYLTPQEHVMAINRLNSYLMFGRNILEEFTALWNEGAEEFKEYSPAEREKIAAEKRKKMIEERCAAIRAQAATDNAIAMRIRIQETLSKTGNLNFTGTPFVLLRTGQSEENTIPGVTVENEAAKMNNSDVDNGGSVNIKITETEFKQKYKILFEDSEKLFYVISAIIFLFGCFKVVSKINMGEDVFRSISIWVMAVIAVLLLGYFTGTITGVSVGWKTVG